MASARGDKVILEWNERFRRDNLASRIIASLRHRSDEIWGSTFDLLQQQSPEYRNSVDEGFTKESKSHCNELLETIIAVANGTLSKSGADPFNFVRRHAQWRARHQVPLAASLHAYRLAHKTYWGITRELGLQHTKQEEAIRSLTMLSDFWIEFFDHVGAVLAEAHAVEEGLVVSRQAGTQAALINDLLSGLQPRAAEAQQLCAVFGIRAGAPMAVVIARPLQPSDGQQIDLEVTLRSFVRLVEQALPSATFGKLVDSRSGEVTAIVFSARDTARSIAKALRRSRFARRAAQGIVAGVGISLDKAETDRLPEALGEARLALEFARVAQPIVHYPEIELPEFLIRRADSTAYRLIPPRAQHLSPTGKGQSGKLSRTIRTFADCNLNVKQTASRMGLHINTVYFRLNRIHRLTGFDPRTYSGVSQLLTVVRLLEIHGNGDSS